METLKKRRDFLAAARAKKAVTKGFILQCRVRRSDEATEVETLRVGYTASKKVGNAVLRNTAKRRLRSVAREVLVHSGNPECDYVLIARADKTIERDYQDLCVDMEHALRKVSML